VRLVRGLRCPGCGTELKADDIEVGLFCDVVTECPACGLQIQEIS
jgi:TusA-related sulfurtransferase